MLRSRGTVRRSAFPPAHDHDDVDVLYVACPGCVARVKVDQADAEAVAVEAVDELAAFCVSRASMEPLPETGDAT
jgi:hypothetical protein